jgi:hypothetical protein
MQPLLNPLDCSLISFRGALRREGEPINALEEQDTVQSQGEIKYLAHTGPIKESHLQNIRGDFILNAGKTLRCIGQSNGHRTVIQDIAPTFEVEEGM